MQAKLYNYQSEVATNITTRSERWEKNKSHKLVPEFFFLPSTPKKAGFSSGMFVN